MSVCWIISGACSGVGKTYLSTRLVECLPRAVYAKHGHHPAKPGKPDNYFRDVETLKQFMAEQSDKYRHLVIESNTLAREGVGDLVIFLEATSGAADLRSDVEQLRTAAQIRIDTKERLGQWQNILNGHLPTRTRNSVLSILTEQRQQMYNDGGLAVRSKLWLLHGDMFVVGPGLARLLEEIEIHGTLRAAAKITGISYRHAWNVIKGAEKHLGRPLVAPRTGGSGGGGSMLTTDGEQVLILFRRLSGDVAKYAGIRMNELMAEAGWNLNGDKNAAARQ